MSRIDYHLESFLDILMTSVDISCVQSQVITQWYNLGSRKYVRNYIA